MQSSQPKIDSIPEEIYIGEILNTFPIIIWRSNEKQTQTAISVQTTCVTKRQCIAAFKVTLNISRMFNSSFHY